MNNLLVIFSLLGLISVPLLAEPRVVERVISIVVDEPILLSEIKEREQKEPGKESPAKTAAVIAQLQTEAALSRECKKSNFEATADEIRQTEQSIMKQHRLNEEQLVQALLKQGMTMEEFRDQLKKQNCKMKLIQNKVKSKVQLSSQDVEREYERKYGNSKTNFRVHLHQILFNKMIAGSNMHAKEVAKRIHGGESFLAVEKQMASSKEVISTGDIGVFSHNELDPRIEEVAFSLREGQIGGPIESDLGFHIIWLQKRVPVEKIPLEKVKKDLHNQLYEKEIERVFKHYVDGLLESNYVETRKMEPGGDNNK